MAKQELTAERLRELLTYDPLTGVFTWRVNRGGCRVGEVAGTPHCHGYTTITIDYKRYLAHRLAWLYVHGVFPEHGTDHRYADRSDNRIEHIRPATQAQNTQNLRSHYSNNKCGFLGVSKSRSMWRAEITVAGVKKFIGRFETPEIAHAAYIKEKAALHPFQTLTESN